MSKKDIDDYLTEGIHGVRLPKQAERDYFLGTLRERIILALSIGEVMRDRGLEELDHAMQEFPEAKLIFNGHVATKFQTEEKKIAAKHNIPYTVHRNEDDKTDIGAVLTLDTAINREKIYLEDYFPDKTKTGNEHETDKTTESASETPSLFSRIKNWLS